MYKKLIIASLLIAIVLIYGCSSNSNSPGIKGQTVVQSSGNVGIEKGNLAPDFSLKTIDGKDVRLSELTKDKPTVLYFFATWCPNCARDFAAVKDVYPQYSDKVNFLAIDIDSKESESQIAGYKQRMGLTNIDFAAGNRNILSKYNVVYTTTKFYIGKDGKILNKGVGGIDQNTWHQIFQSMVQ